MRETAEASLASLEPPLEAFSNSRTLFAEALGTALLLAIVIGSGIMGEQQRRAKGFGEQCPGIGEGLKRRLKACQRCFGGLAHQPAGACAG